MKGLANRFSVVALAALLLGLNACGGSDSNDNVSPPPPARATTGVVSVGVITGFGSVYVNGVRYDTSGASVLMDDQAAAESALKVGQYVELKGHSHGADHLRRRDPLSQRHRRTDRQHRRWREFVRGHGADRARDARDLPGRRHHAVIDRGSCGWRRGRGEWRRDDRRA